MTYKFNIYDLLAFILSVIKIFVTSHFPYEILAARKGRGEASKPTVTPDYFSFVQMSKWFALEKTQTKPNISYYNHLKIINIIIKS